MASTMYYSGLRLDRAAATRGDPEWVTKVLGEASTTVLPLWRDKCLVRDGSPVTRRRGDAGDLLAAAEDLVFLGLDDGSAVFAADVSALEQPAALVLADADTVMDIRALAGAVTPVAAGMFAYARGIAYWHRHQRFCGACGGRTDARSAGHHRICLSCGTLLFPRIEPAVIVLVELPGEPARCLLGRHAGAAPGRFSTLAGFVEIGESLEDAVRREVAEEAGVSVGRVTYQASQAWPFPAGLMAGFTAGALSSTIRADHDEVLEARWFTASELRARIADPSLGGPYRVDSIGRILIEDWLASQASRIAPPEAAR
jgi:NAD+ diphosphatase